MNPDSKKLKVAKSSLDYIEHDCVLGVGTGSTVNFLIDLLPDLINKIQAVVSSSDESTKRLEAHGFEVSNLNNIGNIDLYIDGADEATKNLHLIKGGGGALTREKILAASAKKFVCIVDDSKIVDRLGKFPLPIEVLPMAQSYIAREIVKMKGQPILRENFITDNGNHILDIHNLDITNPIEMETVINQIPGVMTVGIFARRPADILLIAEENTIKIITDKD
jgi:ribose 5-phosphate isomerase A